MARSKGFALIITIVLILVIATIILGLVSFIANSAYLIMGRVARETAISAAQAGVYWMIADYVTNNSVSKVTLDSYLIPKLDSYKVGTDANLLLVDADFPTGILTTSLASIGLANIGASDVTISRVIVEWDFGDKITAVSLGGEPGPNYSWIGSRSSPADIILNKSYEIDAGASYTNNFFIFHNVIPRDSIISVTFYCLDDSSSRKALLYNAGRSGNKEFSITSTGKVVSGRFTWRRTIEATYDVGTSRITSWNETEKHL